MGFDTRIDTFKGEICAILKIRCQDQDQAQKDFGRTLFIGGINMHSEKTTIRLAAVDMDGTLLHDDKSISDYTLDVLRRIVKKGVILVPASGRPIGGMKEAVLNNVDGIQYAICSNGAMLMDVPANQGVFETKYVVNAAGVYADKFHNMVSEKKIPDAKDRRRFFERKRSFRCGNQLR